jgi:hypothetical protein
MIDFLPLYSWVEDMARRSTKVTTMQISKYSGRPHKGRLERAVACIDSLNSFKKENAGSGAFGRLGRTRSVLRTGAYSD